MTISPTVSITGADGHLRAAPSVLAGGFPGGDGTAAIGVPGVTGFQLFALAGSGVCVP
jgi:hypothetical protein